MLKTDVPHKSFVEALKKEQFFFLSYWHQTYEK